MWWIILLLLVLLVLFIIAMVHLGFHAPRIRETATPAKFGLSFEAISIPALGNAQLFGWFLPVTNSTQTIILLHGWGGNAQMMLPLAQPFIDAGSNVLLFDSRNHGRSDRAAVSSMPRFAEDMDSAIDWLHRQHPQCSQKIGLLGHSVGAAAVLLCASRRRDIAAVISIAAFAHPDRLMRRYLSQRYLPAFTIAAILRYVQWIIGHRFDLIAPLNTICDIDCPVLLVHGQQDATVPLDDAHEIYQHCQRKNIELLEIDGADHDSVELIEQHAHRLIHFLDRCGFQHD